MSFFDVGKQVNFVEFLVTFAGGLFLPEKSSMIMVSIYQVGILCLLWRCEGMVKQKNRKGGLSFLLREDRDYEWEISTEKHLWIGWHRRNSWIK